MYKLILTATILIFSGCQSKITQEDYNKLQKVEIEEAINSIKSKYSHLENFKFYRSTSKHLVGKRFVKKLHLYGITEKKNIDECLFILKESIKKAPDWYTIKVVFYEKEILKRKNNVTNRGQETIIYETTVEQTDQPNSIHSLRSLLL
jgi:hypothetical protein